MRRFAPIFAVIILTVVNSTAQSDEGMWLLNDPPREYLLRQYRFDLTDAWLTRAMNASVRFNNGGSGSFVSPDGLLVTNHHIGADSLQKLTTPERNLLKDGFYAKTRAEELKCPDLELNVLRSIEDVTERVNSAIKPGLPPAEAAAARRAVMSQIEKESTDKTSLRSDVVTLYQGGLYHLYRYQKFTDVRLVFAPESAVASFGGDVDNFEFPRFGLDVCFVRAYQNDKPVKSDQFFPWSKTGVTEGELVFVSGHPGTTNRMETLAHLLYRRDRGHPYAMARLRAMEATVAQYSDRGPDERREATTDLHEVANSRKAIAGQYQGLLDPKILDAKAKSESELRQRDPSATEAWDRVAQSRKALAEFDKQYSLFEQGQAFYSELFPIARHLVRMSVELSKPNTERLREYRDSALESLKFQLFSPAPIDAKLEQAKLTGSLTFLAEQLGGEHPMVVAILAGKPPAVRAAELVSGSTLFDPAKRNALFEGGAKAIASSNDSMIQLAKSIDAESRAIRKRFETEVEEPERQAYGRISKVRFNAFGRGLAPDATFTLRLAFGIVKGYDVDGHTLPFQTTFAGLFERAAKMDYREPFALPERWRQAKSRMNLAAPLDFVSTADTIGGNSGSPVLNRAGELVGINFDRNRHGLVRNFVYTDMQARHIAVSGLGVLEALKSVYNATGLVAELRGQK